MVQSFTQISSLKNLKKWLSRSFLRRRWIQALNLNGLLFLTNKLCFCLSDVNVVLLLSGGTHCEAAPSQRWWYQLPSIRPPTYTTSCWLNALHTDKTLQHQPLQLFVAFPCFCLFLANCCSFKRCANFELAPLHNRSQASTVAQQETVLSERKSSCCFTK